MKKILGISLLAIMVVLTGCNSEEANSKEKGSATVAKAETKVQNREDVELADNEILVIDEKTGESEKLFAEATKEEITGVTFKLPTGYKIVKDDLGGDFANIEAPNGSYISFAKSTITNTTKEDLVNMPTFNAVLDTKYNDNSIDKSYDLIDVSSYNDDFVKNNMVYMVTYTPLSSKYKKAVAGLYMSGDKFYDFEIGLGNNDYSDDVVATAFGIFAAVK